MQNELIDETGAYRTNFFYGIDGKWTLSSSQSVSNVKGHVMNTIDTFKSQSGRFKSMTRIEVYQLFEEGKIRLTEL